MVAYIDHISTKFKHTGLLLNVTILYYCKPGSSVGKGLYEIQYVLELFRIIKKLSIVVQGVQIHYSIEITTMNVCDNVYNLLGNS